MRARRRARLLGDRREVRCAKFESASIGKLDPLTGPAIAKYGLSLTDVANLAPSGQNPPYNEVTLGGRPEDLSPGGTPTDD